MPWVRDLFIKQKIGVQQCKALIISLFLLIYYRNQHFFLEAVSDTILRISYAFVKNKAKEFL